MIFFQIGREVEEFDTTELEDELERQVECEKDLTLDEENRKSQKERITKEIAELEVSVLLFSLTPPPSSPFSLLGRGRKVRFHDFMMISSHETLYPLLPFSLLGRGRKVRIELV